MGTRTLGDDLVDALGRGELDVQVERRGLRARAKARGAGPYGADVEEISVERGEGRGPVGAEERTGRVAHGIADRVDYLAEPLEVLEHTGERGQLRSRRERVRDGEYYEVDVHEGDRVDVTRQRWDRETRQRRPISRAEGHDTLRRLVDDLGELIDTAGVETQD